MAPTRNCAPDAASATFLHVETRIELLAADGVRIEALRAQSRSGRTAVLCHPHPDFGGSMHVALLEILVREFASVGFGTLRFDFRRPGTVDERRLDLAAAVDAAGGNVVLAGWSFGADIALAHTDDRVVAVAAVAPTLRFAAPVKTRPVLVLKPEFDQYAPASYGELDVEVVEGCDHFLGGRELQIARRMVEWTSTTLGTERTS